MELKSLPLKIVRVVSLIILSISLLSVGYIYSQRSLIENLIVQTISEKTDNSVTVKSLKLTFQGIDLDSINLNKPGISVAVENLKVRPNLTSLISTYLLKLDVTESIIDTASINRGKVVINLDSIPQDTSKSSKKFDESILNLARAISINNIDVNVIKDGKTLVSVDSINTSYSFDEDYKYKYRVMTSMLIHGNKKPSTIDVFSKGIDERIEANIVLNDFSILEPKKINAQKKIVINSGSVDGKLRITVDSLRDYSVDGKLFVSKLSGSVDGLKIDNVQTEIILAEKQINVENFTLQSGKSTILGDGSYSLASEKYQFAISEGGKLGKDMWINSLIGHNEALHKLQGKYSYNFALNNKGVKGTLLLNDIKYDNMVSLDEIRVKVSTDFKKVKGAVVLNDSKLLGKFNANIDIESKAVSANGTLKSDGYTFKAGGKTIQVFSDFKKVSYNGNSLDFSGFVDSVLVDSTNQLRNRVVLAARKRGNNFTASINDSTTLRVRKKGKKITVKAYVTNSLWHEDLNLPLESVADLNADLSISGSATLTNGGAKFKTTVVSNFSKESSSLLGKLAVDVGGQIDKSQTYVKVLGRKSTFVQLDEKVFKPEIDAEIIDTVLSVKRISLGDGRAILSGLFSKNDLNGVLTFYNYDLDLNGINKIPVTSRINGNVFIRGNLEKPLVRSLLNISRLNIKNSGNYSVNLDLKYENDTLKNMTDIKYESRGYALGKITKLEVADNIIIQAEGTNIKMYQISDRVDDMKLSGKVSYRLDFRGKDFNSLDGQFVLDGDDIVFQNHKIKNVYTNVHVANKRINLTEFSATTDELILSATGVYPMDKLESDILNFKVSIRGGILREANKDIKLFPKIVAEKSKADIEFFSQNNEIKLKGLLDLQFDTLFIPTVINYVSKARVKVDLQQGVLSNIVGTGHIDKDSVLITNYEYGEGKKFHLYIEPLGIDFGVIGLTTTENGLPFNFASFQKITDRGRVIPKGNDKFPIFSFTGPLQTPGLRGALELKDTEFTFPMLTEGDGKTPTFLQLDLKLTAKENVFYYLQLRKYLKDQEMVRAKLDAGGFMTVKGPLIAEKIAINGVLGATNNGTVFYGNDFKIDKAKVEFVPQFDREGNIDNIPILSMSAYNMVRDENGFPRRVNLVLKIKEEGADYYSSAGRPGDLKLEIDNMGTIDPYEAKKLHNSMFGMVFGIDQEDTTQTFGDQVTRRGIEYGESYVFNTYLSNFLMAKVKIPFIDVISVDSKILSNYYDVLENSDTRSDWGLLDGSSFEVGSFISDRIYLNYKGTIEDEIDYDEVTITHSSALEFALNQMIQLQLGVEYDPSLYEGNTSAFYGVMFNVPIDM